MNSSLRSFFPSAKGLNTFLLKNRNPDKKYLFTTALIRSDGISVIDQVKYYVTNHHSATAKRFEKYRENSSETEGLFMQLMSWVNTSAEWRRDEGEQPLGVCLPATPLSNNVQLAAGV